MILEKLAFSFAFNLRKQNKYLFHLFNTKLFAVSLNYYYQALWVSAHRIKGGLSDNRWSSVLLASASPSPWYLALPNSHIQKLAIPESIGMKMLLSLQVFIRN